MSEKDVYDFIESFYAKQDNRKIRLLDAILLFDLKMSKKRPVSPEAVEEYLRAGKTPAAWEKLNASRKNKDGSYDLDPDFFK